MAADNKAFIACFGAAMNKMMRNGYKEGELVPTGQVSNCITSQSYV